MAQLLSLLVLALFTVSLGHAAPLDWETFDFEKCQHWLVTQDTRSDAQAQNLADKLNHADWQGTRPDLISGDALPQSEDIPIWQVVQAFNLSDKGDPIFSACKLDWPKSISCAAGQGFPLSNMTFVLSSSVNSAPTFKCHFGCQDTNFKILYELGYESDNSSEYKSALKKYKRQCPNRRKSAR